MLQTPGRGYQQIQKHLRRFVDKYNYMRYYSVVRRVHL
nr:MAG TPA: hypothetical protein [Caudoviricetes sp.]